jgi:hypothetical protein
MDRILEDYRQILLDCGFATDEVSIHSPERYCPSIADCILAEREVLKDRLNEAFRLN